MRVGRGRGDSEQAEAKAKNNGLANGSVLFLTLFLFIEYCSSAMTMPMTKALKEWVRKIYLASVVVSLST